MEDDGVMALRLTSAAYILGYESVASAAIPLRLSAATGAPVGSTHQNYGMCPLCLRRQVHICSQFRAVTHGNHVKCRLDFAFVGPENGDGREDNGK
jgi:hypothetical protein